MTTRPIRLFYHAGPVSRRRPDAMLFNWLRYGTVYLPSYNVGDMISPIVVGGLSGRPVKRVNAWQRDKLVAIGSVLPAALNGDTVWGAGLKSAASRHHLVGKTGVDIRSVRGPLTRRELVAIGLRCPDVYGDPGLLLPLIYSPTRTCEYPVGIIPHIKQEADIRPLCQGLIEQGAIVISPRQAWEQYVQCVNKCRLVVSTSLHGIIIADAYGIPAILMKHKQFMHDDAFKFEDYYESTSRRLAWRSSEELLECTAEDLVSLGRELVRPRIDLSPLLEAFPFPIRIDRQDRESLLVGTDFS